MKLKGPIHKLLILVSTICVGCKPFESITKIEGGASSSSVECKADLDADFNIFKSTFHPVAKMHCADCHGTTQSPKFADSDATSAYTLALQNFSFGAPESSTLYYRATNGHCGASCNAGSPQSIAVTNSLKSWAQIKNSAVSKCIEPPVTPPTPPVVTSPPPVVTNPPPVVTNPPPVVTNPPVPTPNPVEIPEVVTIPIPEGIGTSGSVGILHFAQILPAMSSVTRIPASNEQINSLYQRSFTGYSGEGLADSVSPALMLSYTSLAATYCKALVNQQVALSNPLRKFFKSVDFAKATLGFTAEIQIAVTQELWKEFLGRSPSSEEQSSMNTLFVDAGTAIKSTSVPAIEKSKALLVLACTVPLASLEFLKN